MQVASVGNITVKDARNLNSARAVSLAICEGERNSYFSAKYGLDRM
jgi:hypothetical protein